MLTIIIFTYAGTVKYAGCKYADGEALIGHDGPWTAKVNKLTKQIFKNNLFLGQGINYYLMASYLFGF